MSKILNFDSSLKSKVWASPSLEEKSKGYSRETPQTVKEIFNEKKDPEKPSKKINYFYVSVLVGVTALVAVSAVLYFQRVSLQTAFHDAQQTIKKIEKNLISCSTTNSDIRNEKIKLNNEIFKYESKLKNCNRELSEEKLKSSTLSQTASECKEKFSNLQQTRTVTGKEVEDLISQISNLQINNKKLLQDAKDAVQCAKLRQSSSNAWKEDSNDAVDETQNNLRQRCQALFGSPLYSDS